MSIKFPTEYRNHPFFASFISMLCLIKKIAEVLFESTLNSVLLLITRINKINSGSFSDIKGAIVDQTLSTQTAQRKDGFPYSG